LNPGIIGDYRGLSKLSDKEDIDHIIVAMPERRGVLPVDELLKCKMAGIDVEDGVSFFERMTGKVDLDELKPSWLIFSDGFKINKITKTVKRTADIIFSSLGILLSIPFFIIVPLLLKLDSSGPVFFRQERIGENESVFTLMKFRSMQVDAETGSGPVWAQKNDPRVTRLGKFIRKTRIDEIPQLFNVLRGEMSFVGPRPERPNFVKKLNEEIPYYILRHSIKPGLTGWAQIRYPYGSSVKDAIEKLKYDLYYIKNISFLLDIAIIFSTVRVVISRRGAR
jgi:sugar transferase (PEP-CTERM system associated)